MRALTPKLRLKLTAILAFDVLHGTCSGVSSVPCRLLDIFSAIAKYAARLTMNIQPFAC